jgi:hypothetical protein
MYATILKLDGADRDESAHLDALRLYGVLDSPPGVSSTISRILDRS